MFAIILEFAMPTPTEASERRHTIPLSMEVSLPLQSRLCITAVLAHSVHSEQIEPMLSWTFVFLALFSLVKAGEDDHHVASREGRMTL